MQEDCWCSQQESQQIPGYLSLASFIRKIRTAKWLLHVFYFPVGNLILVEECPGFSFFLLVVLKYYKYQQQLKRNYEIQEKLALLGRNKLSCIVMTKSQRCFFCPWEDRFLHCLGSREKALNKDALDQFIHTWHCPCSARARADISRSFAWIRVE